MAKDTESAGPFIVGIAASAGGLEAVSALVKSLPADAGAAYVIAQHMSPTHKSLLTTLISRETDLPVMELNKTDTEMKANTIYITPPNSDVVLKDKKLSLIEPSGHPATPKPSADRLFKSIAEQCGSHCAGIVLSGTGTDGSYGVQAIREAGGITIAQDGASAKYDGMPTAAIETGCIDLTLSPNEIGKHLNNIIANPSDFGDARVDSSAERRQSELLQVLMARTRLDFREYKENTINRRIRRRMVALNINDYDEYVDYCRTSTTELDALHRDLLISVTRFFRDPHQFNQLEREINALVKERKHAQIRVWVAGCATGEEAYSLAILLAEALGGPKALEQYRVQIFATDVDERVLETARKGVYPITAAHDVPPEFLETYFQVSAGSLQVVPELRAITLFSKHNLFQDPPFINVDLVSLRNVLIYFKQSLQERVLSRVHYALGNDGLLFLGTSESIGAMDVYFEQKTSTDKIFVRRNTVKSDPFNMPDFSMSSTARPAIKKDPETDAAKSASSNREAQLFEALARAVAPNGFIVTRGHDIVRVFGDATPFLELNERSSLRLSIRILRRGLRDEAPSLISMAFKTKTAREGRWHSIKGPDFNQVKLECYPIIATSGEDHMLVALRTRMENEQPAPIESLSDKERTQYILQIESEMQSTREALQQTVEELQTSNEELQSVNEELQSTNEELQATNEELETSNEELQSTNEELITVNEEMQVNASELQTVSTELTAVLAASPFPMLVVDQALQIRRASNSALDYFGLSELPPAGFHLSQCSLPEGFPSLTKTANAVFKSRSRQTIDIEDNESLVKLVFAPYSDTLGNLLGLTISVSDFDGQAGTKIIEAIEQMAGIGSWNYNLGTQTLLISPEVRRSLGLSRDQGRITLANAERLLHVQDREMVRARVARAIEQKRPFRFEARSVHNSNRVLHVQVSGAPLLAEDGSILSFVGAFRDVTTSLSGSMFLETLERMQSQIGVAMFSYDVDNDKIFLPGEALVLLGLDEKRHPDLRTFTEAFQRTDQRKLSSGFDEMISSGGTLELKLKIAGKRGKKAECALNAMSRMRPDGATSHIYGTISTTEKS